MRRKKKMISLLIIVILIFALPGCSSMPFSNVNVEKEAQSDTWMIDKSIDEIHFDINYGNIEIRSVKECSQELEGDKIFIKKSIGKNVPKITIDTKNDVMTIKETKSLQPWNKGFSYTIYLYLPEDIEFDQVTIKSDYSDVSVRLPDDCQEYDYDLHTEGGIILNNTYYENDGSDILNEVVQNNAAEKIIHVESLGDIQIRTGSGS